MLESFHAEKKFHHFSPRTSWRNCVECGTTDARPSRLATDRKRHSTGSSHPKTGIIRATLIKLGFATDDELPHNSIKNTSYATLESDGVDFFVKETVGIAKEEFVK